MIVIKKLQKTVLVTGLFALLISQKEKIRKMVQPQFHKILPVKKAHNSYFTGVQPAVLVLNFFSHFYRSPSAYKPYHTIPVL